MSFGYGAPAAPDASAFPAASSTASAVVAGTVLDLTNVERRRAGLAPLAGSSRLGQAAQLHADQLAAANRLEHVLTGGRYPAPIDRLAAAGYQWQAYAENIATGQPNAAAVLLSWMRSPGHRANILNAGYTELGVGYGVDGSGRPYYVQVFGRPAS